MLAKEVGQLPVNKVVVGLAYNVGFLGAEESLEHRVAGEIDAICVF